MAVSLTRRQFTVSDYSRLVEAGVLSEDERVELIDGDILEMSPIGPVHAGCVRRVTRLFTRRVGDRATVSTQNPLRVGERSEPEPDLALLRYRSDDYSATHPTPEDVLLLIEVADSSLEYDRRVKVPLYARSGIPELWLVDLTQQRVAIYREPSSNGYGTVRIARRGETISPTAFPDLVMSVDDILG